MTIRGEAALHTGRDSLRCRCVDISAEGIALVSPAAVKPRQRVRIETCFGEQHLVLEAITVRRRRTREGHVLGLRFTALGAAMRAELDALLRAMQLQAALVQRGCGFADRLPQLRIPMPGSVPAAVPVPMAAAMPAPRPAAVPAAAATPAPVPTAAPMHAAEPRAPIQPTPPPWPATRRELPPWPKQPVASAPAPSPPVVHRLDEGWSDEELATAHYRPYEPSGPVPTPRAPAVEPSARLELDLDLELPDDVDRTDAVDTTGSVTMTGMPQPHWEPGAPAALAEMVDTDAGAHPVLPDALDELDDLPEPPPTTWPQRTEWPQQRAWSEAFPVDRTLAAPSTAPSLEPARTGKTMLMRLEDVLAYLPERPASGPDAEAVPRLSPDLQAALDRVRRREPTPAPGASRRPHADADERS